MIISDGYNGTPSGFENCCEDDNGLTKWYVLHAEANAILKVAKSTQSCDGATLYITMSPCKDCSKLLHQAGIVRVVYQNSYKDLEGIELLKRAGVEVVQVEDLSSLSYEYKELFMASVGCSITCCGSCCGRFFSM